MPDADQAALHHAFRTLFQPWSGSPPPAAVAASDTIVGYLEHLVDVTPGAPRPTTSSACSWTPATTTASG